MDAREKSIAGDANAPPPPTAKLEWELAMLVRGLEAVQRRRSYLLERAHYLVIRMIEADGPQTIGAIARRLILDDSTVTRQIAAMAKAGLVTKRANPHDARSALVHVSAAGTAAAAEMRKQRFARLDILFAEWSEDERAAAAAVIGRLNRSLHEVLQDAPEGQQEPAR